MQTYSEETSDRTGSDDGYSQPSGLPSRVNTEFSILVHSEYVLLLWKLAAPHLARVLFERLFDEFCHISVTLRKSRCKPRSKPRIESDNIMQDKYLTIAVSARPDSDCC